MGAIEKIADHNETLAKFALSARLLQPRPCQRAGFSTRLPDWSARELVMRPGADILSNAMVLTTPSTG